MTSSTNNLPLIRLSTINPFLIELARRKLDAGVLLRGMGLPGAVPATDEVFVSALTIYQLVEKTARVANDPYLGFSIGQDLDLQAWGPIASAAAESGTIGDLLNRFIVNALDHASSARYFLRTEGDRSVFGFKRLVEPPFAPAQNDAFYLGFLSKLLMHATGDHWNPASVLARVADPDAIPPVVKPLRFVKGDRRGTRVSFPTEWQFETFEKTAFPASGQCGTVSPVPGSLIDSIHFALSPHVHETNLTVERAAEICGFSRRRLSRDLRKKGTTLAKEIADLRARRAGKALIESNRLISEVALSVGFVDPTVFSRAFKNWTGQSPQEYRKQHRT